VAAALRELAMASESLSAQQLAELLNSSEKPSVKSLRTFMHTETGTFVEVRYGGFVLGRSYQLPSQTV
jgi:hypothetical protein